MPHGTPWDRAEEDALAAAWLAGDTPKDIAAALGRTRAAVLFRRQVLGLPIRDRGAGVPRVGSELVAEGTRVQLMLPDALLPPSGRRPAVIREALELRRNVLALLGRHADLIRTADHGDGPALLGVLEELQGMLPGRS